MRLFLLFLAMIVVSGPGCGREARVARARKATEAHDLDRAEREWRSILQDAPEDPDALYGLGWTYHQAGLSERARPYFERCVELHPDSPLGYKGLGSLALGEGDLIEARLQFESAMTLSPDDTSILNSMAILEIREDHPEKALAILEGLLKREPENANIILGYGEALLRTGRRTEALALVDAHLAGNGTESQGRARILQLRARLLVAMTIDRVDPAKCESTAPPVFTWLDQADADLVEVERLGGNPGLAAAKRLVARRRAAILDVCPARSMATPPPG